MKFLYFTDTHIKGVNPKNRKDDYYNTLKLKFREIQNICEENQIDYIIHGGDWFDRPDISPAVVRDFAIIIRGFKQKIYTIAGNHDIFGQNPETIKRTMLGLLEGIGLVKLIGYDDEVILEKDGIRVQLTGKPFNFDIDGENFRKYYCVKKRRDVDYAVNIVHGMLLDKPFIEGLRYTLISDIVDTEADITLAGHYHSGFPTKVINGKYFINPGSLVRVTNSLNEISRRPKVTLIKIDNGIFIQDIELKSALPGDEVLDRAQLESSQDRMLKLHNFYNSLSKSTQYNKIDLNKIIYDIASDQNVQEEVKNEAVRRITAARESLSLDEDLT